MDCRFKNDRSPLHYYIDMELTFSVSFSNEIIIFAAVTKFHFYCQNHLLASLNLTNPKGFGFRQSFLNLKKKLKRWHLKYFNFLQGICSFFSCELIFRWIVWIETQLTQIRHSWSEWLHLFLTDKHYFENNPLAVPITECVRPNQNKSENQLLVSHQTK